MSSNGFLSGIEDPLTVITPIDSGLRFPEIIPIVLSKYETGIRKFASLIASSKTSADLLHKIRSGSFSSSQRMALLKMFRRCVSGVCDTETTKKITKITTESLVSAYGHTFKPISKLKTQFAKLSKELLVSLAVAVGEYNNRGQQGYVLTGLFFDWFEDRFSGHLTIDGPRGAGPDIELNTIIPDFSDSCPCDFVIRDKTSKEVLAVGFARYDSTRGGAQSDDRTGGNKGKVYSIRDYCTSHKDLIRILFLAEGPGLAHKDTWQEACELDCIWEDNVRVTTLKLADQRVTLDWLRGK